MKSRGDKMEKWFISMKKAEFGRIADQYKISPILARLIRNRDIMEDEEIDRYLNGTMADLYDGIFMKDMNKAVEIVREKIETCCKIRVIGDYDIDGVNATYILKQGISRLGGLVDTDIPDRMKDGYGLNKTLIDRAIEDGIDTIVTCDNGIAALEEIEYAKQCGMTVIVTDHHEIPFEETKEGKKEVLPMADAVVDPHRKDCEYPFKGLCGAAVAYKLIETLYNIMQKETDKIEDLIENVAIATVGDVMDLNGENRIFVKYGIQRLRHTNNFGLKALMECNNIPEDALNTYHIGFVLGPCINASGRLDTAKRALSLLEATHPKEALLLAEDLKALNDSRKEITERGVEQAVEMIEQSSLKKDHVLVVYLPDCHESVAGIIAGRLREKYSRPVFVLTKAEEGVKGSGRSIEEYNMFEEMTKCKPLFTKFGGHKMAAGVSLPEENVEIFRHRINEICTLTKEDLIPKVKIDMPLPLSYITEGLIEQLELLEPFGKGNVKPLFAGKNFKVLYPKIVGKNKNVLKFLVQDEDGVQLDAVYFGNAKECLEYIQRKKEMMFTYYPSINEYMGRRTVQITIVNYQ